MNRSLLLLATFVIISHALSATVKLPSFFSDNMVLQQQTDAAIWGWAKANATVQVVTSWNKKKYAAKAGADGKWKTKISTPAAGGPYEITISEGNTIILRNVLIGEVWFCSGQSNMEMPMKGFRDQPILGSNDAIFNSANDNIRIYTVPRSVQNEPQDTSKHSSWKTAKPEDISNFSATAYYFGRILYQQLKVPVALINDSYGGSPAEAFMSRESLKDFPDIKIHAPGSTEKLNNKNATTLYNGMIRPIIGYTIKGCIWYQGESNNGRPDEYEKLFPAMIALWRNEWGQGNFPFYFAQIAPYTYSTYSSGTWNEKMNSAYLRDAQRRALDKTPMSGMVVLMDNGEERNIHPADKEKVGKRFAYLALGDAYQQKGFAYQSPVLDSALINGSTVTIKLRHTPNGLTSYGKPLTQFEIAGKDKVFRPAKAVIARGTILVSSPDVPEPVAVRYAFKDFIMGELFNTEGFPVSSFRTDDW
ncbi:MAG: sialate O-acetylesterase [Chitinophagaceae bacterium]|nr:sialate O-acetylesterase [Chitinophagaceae bacterium]